MSSPPLPAEAVAALAARDAALAALHARLRDAEARAERAEAERAALRAELVVLLQRLQAAERALAGQPLRKGWLRRLAGR